MRSHKCVRIHTYIHIYQIYTHIYKYTHTYTHIYTNNNIANLFNIVYE